MKSHEELIELEFCYRIIETSDGRGQYFYGEREFFKTLANGLTLRMKFHRDGRTLLCRCEGWSAPTEVVLALHGNSEAISGQVQLFVTGLRAEIQGAAEHLMSIIKYRLNQRSIGPDLITEVWGKWRCADFAGRLPVQGVVIVQIAGVYPLNDTAQADIQKLLDANVAPLRALVHLHRALDENNPSHRWIEATIAAELAIKEGLSLARPELKSLLLECPSPPMHKMYGPLLEEYLGEKSPYLKELQRGAEKRNKLLHRHTRIEVAAAEAAEYVNVVRRTIDHLLGLIYPRDPMYARQQG